MAKFKGIIGFGETVETSPGVWSEQITTRTYKGELLQNTWRWEGSDQVNDDINIANEISILADPFASQNLHNMRYVEFRGTKWKITRVAVKYPRLILTIGGVYNGQ